MRPARAAHNLATQRDFLCRDGKFIVDDIIRFEELPGAFAPVAKKVFGTEIALPHVNRSEAPDVTADLTPELRTIVRRSYAEDFETFGYPD